MVLWKVGVGEFSAGILNGLERFGTMDRIIEVLLGA